MKLCRRFTFKIAYILIILIVYLSAYIFLVSKKTDSFHCSKLITLTLLSGLIFQLRFTEQFSSHRQVDKYKLSPELHISAPCSLRPDTTAMHHPAVRHITVMFSSAVCSKQPRLLHVGATQDTGLFIIAGPAGRPLISLSDH